MLPKLALVDFLVWMWWVLAACQLVRGTERGERLMSEQEQQLWERCGPEAERHIANCLEPMLGYANALQAAEDEEQETDSGADSASLSASLPHHSTRQHFSLQGGAVFRRLCALYAQFKQCTLERHNQDAHCANLAERAVDASYGFMCGAGHAQFERHADCFAAVENRADYVRCKREAARAMDRAVAGADGDEDGNGKVHARTCSAMQEYLNCCRPLVRHSCGPEAWLLVARITRESLRVSLPDCDLQQALQD